MKTPPFTLTFKQFLEDDNTFEELEVEMWFRLHVTDDKAVARELGAWYCGNGEELSQDTMAFLYDYFADEMPYDVAKGRGDASPEEWFWEKFNAQLQAAGIMG